MKPAVILSSISILVIFLSFPKHSRAQLSCGFDRVNQRSFKSSPSYRAAFVRQTRTYADNQTRIRQALPVRSVIDTFTVVFHVLHIGQPLGSRNNPLDDDIRSWLESVNEIYAGIGTGSGGAGDLGIRFELAKTDPYCSPTNGINHIDATSLINYVKYGVTLGSSPGTTIGDIRHFILWDPQRYLNIWLVYRFDSASGVGFFPGNPDLFGPVIIASGTGNSFLLAHELGHSFALEHVFAGANGDQCPGNTDCSVDGDGICDTDPVTQPSGACRSGINSCTGTAYNPNTENNYMNYSTCGNYLFTPDQRVRMRWAIQNFPLLDTLSKSTARFAPGEHGNCSTQIQLRGEKLRSGGILLTWTGGMKDSPFFVQKSSDIFHYQELVQLSPASLSEYSLKDYSLLQSQNYYRLRQLRTDGQWIYSNVVNFSDSIVINDQVVLRRNPVTSYIDFQLGTVTEDKSDILGNAGTSANLRLFDMAGRVLYSDVLQVYSFQRLRVPAENLRPGEYVLQVTFNGKRYTKRVLKI